MTVNMIIFIYLMIAFVVLFLIFWAMLAFCFREKPLFERKCSKCYVYSKNFTKQIGEDERTYFPNTCNACCESDQGDIL